MRILSPLLFGISANLDALLIGASYGLRKIHISFRQNLLISLITFLGSFLSVGLGKLLEPVFPANMTSYAGSILLFLFGGYLLGKGILRRWSKPAAQAAPKEADALQGTESDEASQRQTLQRAESDEASQRQTLQRAESDEAAPRQASSPGRSTPSLAEIFALGVMLSLNNIGIGFGTGMAGIAMLPTMIMTLVLSLLFMMTGNRLGSSHVLGTVARVADPLSGALLICLGILELAI